MSKKPLVSVVIIFLNAGKPFFEEAIASVFGQTYDNWELLLVDDGSTDISTEIAQHYAQQYPDRVRYLEHEGHQNRGMSASRNLGFDHAQGEYIALLDADDIWLAEKLERQVALLEAYSEAGMVYGSTRMWHSWTEKPEDMQRDRQRVLGVQPDTLVQPPGLIPLFLAREAETPGTCSILVRREVVRQVRGFEASFRSLFEDQAFLYKVCLQTPVFVESGCWDRYRQHADGSCNVAVAEGHYNPFQLNPAHFTFLKWLEKYISQHRLRTPEVRKALGKALFPYRYPHLNNLFKQVQYRSHIAKKQMKSIARQALPAPAFKWILSLKYGKSRIPSVGNVQFGDFRRLNPISESFGFDRGLPIDRYYVENFLSHHANNIQGRVLEIGDNYYTQKFGGSRVTQSDVLHVVEGNPDATIVGDLTNADHISSDTYDCLVLTQTLHLIYDMRSALETIHRILKPAGVALITFPGISQVSHDEWKDYWCWGLTPVSARKLFEEFFPSENTKIESFGNVLTAVSFLQGIAAQELHQEELDYFDPSYPVLITVEVTKPGIEQ